MVVSEACPTLGERERLGLRDCPTAVEASGSAYAEGGRRLARGARVRFCGLLSAVREIGVSSPTRGGRGPAKMRQNVVVHFVSF